MNDPLRDLLERFRTGEPAADEATARLALRVGLAAVFLWFGVDKFLNTGYWAMWVPDAMAPLATDTGLYALGIVEVVLGVGLLWEHRWLREVSAATAGYLALVVVSQGVAPVVRDLGLLGAALYLALRTPGPAAASRSAEVGDAAPDASARVETLAQPSAPRPSPDAQGTASPPGSDAASSARRRRTPSRTVLAALAIVGGLLLGAALAAGVPGWTAARSAGGTGPLLTFDAPTDGATVPAGEVAVRVGLGDGVHALGVNHVHVKVDGRVVDAVYFQPGEDAVETTVQVPKAGQHTLTAFLAYNDHTEYEGSAISVDVTVE